MEPENVYERGLTSWESKMYSESKKYSELNANLENYQQHNDVPLEETQPRGSTGWETLMAQKISLIPPGRRMGNKVSMNSVYSNRIKGKISLSTFKK